MRTEQDRVSERRIALLGCVLAALALIIACQAVLRVRAPAFTWLAPARTVEVQSESPANRSSDQETPARHFAGWDQKDALHAFLKSLLAVACPNCNAVQEYTIHQIDSGMAMECQACRKLLKAGRFRDWIDEQRREIGRMTQ